MNIPIWITRDSDGTLCWHLDQPVLTQQEAHANYEAYTCWLSGSCEIITNGALFPNVAPENCRKATATIVLDDE